MGDTKEPFDDQDLFQPFGLDDAETPRYPEATAPVIEDEAPGEPSVRCPSCGSPNPPSNRHCDQCGARVTQDLLPVAPPPMIRTTAGSRALMVIAGVFATVAAFALIFNIVNRGDESPAPNGTSTETSDPTGTSIAAPSSGAAEKLLPSRVVALTSLPSRPEVNLLDGDPTTEWQDASLAGVGASLSFFFTDPVAIERIEVTNIADPERFLLNYRIRGYRLKFNDISIIPDGELADTQDTQTIEVQTQATTRVVLEVTSTYPAQNVGDRAPFKELALGDVEFIGRPATPADSS